MCADRIPPQTRRRPAESGGFGEALRRAREAREMTLAAVAESTRISPHHLDALERGDLDALPAGPFGRSYIRSYAEVLGIDPAPILEAYHVQEARQGVGAPERDRRMLEQLSQLVGRGAEAGRPLARLRARPVRLAAAAVAIVIVAGVGWLLARNGTREAPARTATPAATTAPAPILVPPPEPGPQSRGGRLAPSPAAGASPRRAQPERAAATPPLAGGGQQAQPQAAKLSPDTLQVSDFGVGSDVVDRRLVGRADRFPEGTRVSFWTLVVGGQPGHVVRHVWFHAGRAVARAELSIGGPHWRTRSSLVLPAGSAGSWTVEARTSDGRLLARNDFVCERRRSR